MLRLSMLRSLCSENDKLFCSCEVLLVIWHSSMGLPLSFTKSRHERHQSRLRQFGGPKPVDAPKNRPRNLCKCPSLEGPKRVNPFRQARNRAHDTPS